MQMLEHLARTMCDTMAINPNEIVVDPRQDAGIAEAFSPQVHWKTNRMHWWQALLPAIVAILREIQKPLPDMVSVGNKTLHDTAAVIDQDDNTCAAIWEAMMENLMAHANIERRSTVTGFTPVLQDWVNTITRRKQGVLILALRGPDGFAKEHANKDIIRTLRACVMNSGREGTAMQLGQAYASDKFMRMDLIADKAIWEITLDKFFSSLDEYNMDFYLHLIHAAEVLGFHHPLFIVKHRWSAFYERACDMMHVNPETKEQFDLRLADGMRKEDFV